MVFHMLAYEEAIGTTADTDLDAIVDDVVTRVSDHFQLQNPMGLLFAFANSATLTRGRVVTPNFRQIARPYIRPIEAAAAPGDDPNIADYSMNPLVIPALEEIQIELTSGIAMGTEQAFGLLGVQSQFDPTPRGDIFTLRGVSTTASVANVWSSLTTTWTDTLPNGTYAVVGGSGFAATAIAFRVIFEEQRWRPGFVASNSAGQRTAKIFRKGRLGVWGRFNNTAMPIVQTLNSAAVSTHEYYLDLIKIA